MRKDDIRCHRDNHFNVEFHVRQFSLFPTLLPDNYPNRSRRQFHHLVQVQIKFPYCSESLKRLFPVLFQV